MFPCRSVVASIVTVTWRAAPGTTHTASRHRDRKCRMAGCLHYKLAGMSPQLLFRLAMYCGIAGGGLAQTATAPAASKPSAAKAKPTGTPATTPAKTQPAQPARPPLEPGLYATI